MIPSRGFGFTSGMAHTTRFPAFFTLLLCAFVPSAHAQYNVYSWTHFEDGALAQGTVPIGTDFANTVQVVDYSMLTTPLPGFRDGPAADEIGRCGLMLKSVPEVWITGIAVGPLLDRDKLGANGRALYQADFYIPPAPELLPNLAVLAMVPLNPGEQRPRTYYRFGITTNNTLYFSKIVNDAAPANLFVQDKDLLSRIPRSSWHRFAIVFEGPNTIRCFIDGREPSFSPLDEPEVRQLQVGILLADNKKSYYCFADNLSIQWTAEDVPAPDSPFRTTWEGPVSPVATASRPTPGTADPIAWLDPTLGSQHARATGKPMFVLFEAPRVIAAIRFNEILSRDPNAIAYLKTVVPIRIDVNQLQGGTYASQFSVFRLPTVLVLDPQGKELARAVIEKPDTWDTFLARLTTPAPKPTSTAP